MELYFGETLLKKDSKIIVPKKKGTIFVWNYILVKHLLKKDSKIIVPRKRNYNYILFLELYFGETLLKKGFQNYSSEKKEPYFFWNYILVKHF